MNENIKNLIIILLLFLAGFWSGIKYQLFRTPKQKTKFVYTGNPGDEILQKKIDSLEMLKPKIVVKTETEILVVEKKIPLMFDKIINDTIKLIDTMYIQSIKEYKFNEKDDYLNYWGSLRDTTLILNVSGQVSNKIEIGLLEVPFLRDKYPVSIQKSNNPYISIKNDIKFSESFKKKKKKVGFGIFAGPSINLIGKPQIVIGAGIVWKK